MLLIRTHSTQQTTPIPILKRRSGAAAAAASGSWLPDHQLCDGLKASPPFGAPLAALPPGGRPPSCAAGVTEEDAVADGGSASGDAGLLRHKPSNQPGSPKHNTLWDSKT